MSTYRESLKDRKRIVVKIGSSSLMHPETGKLDLVKIEKLIRILCDIRNSGKDVVLVSSGAIAVGRMAIGLNERPDELPVKQACAAIGQARLMMVYQKIFAEFKELLSLGVIPVVNENDTVSTDEIQHVQTFGDNDRLSAIVSYLIGADLLILLSDIDGLYTDDPKVNKDAKFIEEIDKVDDSLFTMGKSSSGSSVGTGGMSAKLVAAKIATYSGADMVITNADNIGNIEKIIHGGNVGTLFHSDKKDSFDLLKMIE